MNKKALSLAITLAMALPSVTHALGLGDIQSNSHLNQPFNGKIQVLSASPADIRNMRVKIAAPEVFNRVGIDRPAFLNSMRFRAVLENGKPVILVNSTGPIHEPFVNFLVEVTWPKGQLLKEYTALLDPPVLMQPGSAIASNQVGVRPEPGNRGRINRPAPQAARQAQPQRRVIVAPNRVDPRVNQQARSLQISPEALRALANVADPGVTPRARAASTGRSTYRVKRGDTLYKVARKLGYRGVRTEQMMMALYDTNPAAFHQANVNNLKAGALMQRPSAQQARSMSYRTARAELLAQTKAWKAQRLAGRSGTAEATRPATGSASEKLAASQTTADAAKTDAGSTAAKEEARLEVVGSKGGEVSDLTVSGSATVEALKKQLQMASESLTARSNENAELKSRVTELESLLRKKNRLITLKSEQLAELQARMSGEQAPKAPEQEATTVVAGDTPDMSVDPGVLDEINAALDSPLKTDVTEAGADLQQAVANQIANESGQIIREGEPTEPATQLDDFPALDEDIAEPAIAEGESADEQSAPADTTVSPGVDGGEEEGSMLDSVFGMLGSPMMTAVGGGTLLALLGGLLYMRRRKSSAGEGDADYMDLGLDEELAAQVGSHDEPNPFEEAASGDDKDKDEIFSDQTVRNSDPDMQDEGESKEENILQEADVYLVYGLHDQAEAELRKAISEEPENLAYRAKLIENFKAAGNKEAFEKEARIFKGMEGSNKDKLWADIAEWGKSLIPESNLFSAAAAGAVAAGVAVTAGKAKPEKAAEQFSEDIDSVLEADGLDELDLDSILEDETDDTQVAGVSGSQADSTLDFDGDEKIDSAQDALAEKPEAVSLDDSDDTSLDFDGFDLDEAFSPETALDMPSESSSQPEGEVSDKDESDASSVDFTAESVDFSAENDAEQELAGFDHDELDNIDELDSIDNLIDTESAAELADDEEILAAKEAVANLPDDLLDLDTDDSLADTSVDKPEESTRAFDSANLSLDIDAQDFDKIMPENNVYSSNKSLDSEADDNTFDFDAISGLDDIQSGEEKSATAGVEAQSDNDDNLLADFDDNLSFLDLDDADGDVIEDTQINTKLDLAKAYMDMGDIEGARSTLEEVMLEGNDEQKREAEELLHQTG